MEGLPALRGLLERGYPLEAIITLRPELAAKRSGGADYHPVAEEFRIPLYEVSNINDEQSLHLLKDLSLDLAFLIGWTQIVRPDALSLVRIGMIGAHASLLPINRGRAPINWALIRGLEHTGNTLMWLSSGVDSGDIVDQTKISISPYDTCGSMYQKVAESNREMILKALPRILRGERPGTPQPVTESPILPGRRPEDGLVDWSQSNSAVYDFIRALTKPYPGAFSWLDARRCTIWNAALFPKSENSVLQPGRVLGPVISPSEAACGLAVECNDGVVVLLEIEADGIGCLSGTRLSDLPWTGKVFSNGS
jgi:methionyl-tRNA formyltransferase